MHSQVGHNFFPRLSTSDERQWTWLDEGLNTFFANTWRSKQGHWPILKEEGQPIKIVGLHEGDKANISPIMTNSESIFQFGNTLYENLLQL